MKAFTFVLTYTTKQMTLAVEVGLGFDGTMARLDRTDDTNSI